MDEHFLLQRITSLKGEFGVKCSKYAGAVTVEVLREVLLSQGISTSARDVFIEGVPVEIHLVVPKRGIIPRYNLLYRAEDVLVAMEIKNSGAFGESSGKNAKRVFELIRDRNSRIQCAYVTVTERDGYKWAVTEGELGFPVYTLFWYRGALEKIGPNNARGEFGKLLKWLQDRVAMDT